MITRRQFLKGSAIGSCCLGAAAIGGYAFLNSKRFGRLPQGERLERILSSPNYRDGKFWNLPTAYIPPQRQPDGRGGLKSMFFKKKKLHLEPNRFDIQVIKSELENLDREKDLFVWFGHSSYFLQLGGARILVDPVFCSASPIPFLIGEAFPGTDVFTPEDIPDIDILLITHDHWDHLDYETVSALKNRVGMVVTSLGVGEHFEYWGYESERIEELDWGEKATIDCGRVGVSVRAYPTHHFSGRGFTRNKTLWSSFLVSAAGKKIYFGGDGGYDECFRRIGETMPGIDLAFLENGQYNQRWPRVHTMPDELPLAMRELGAKKYVTGHHAKFCFSTHPWDEPYKNELAAAAYAKVPLLVPKIGEICEI